jgi:hypothetical protein
MARPERFELPTLCSGGTRSIQLSYGRVDEYLDSTPPLRSVAKGDSRGLRAAPSIQRSYGQLFRIRFSSSRPTPF